MEEQEARKLVEEIKNLRIFDDQKITEFLNSKGVSSASDKMKTFKAMAGDHVLDYNYIQNHILEVVSAEDEFIDLIITISEKQTYQSLSKLDGVYGKSSELAMAIYQKLQERGGEWVSAPLAYLLKGVCDKDTERFFQLADLAGKDPFVKTGQIEALRITSISMSIPKSHIDKIIRETSSADKNVRFTALHFLLTANIEDADATSKLIELASSEDMETKRYIARNCFMLCKRRPELALKLLAMLSESDNPALLNDIPQDLGSIAPTYPVECLQIIQKWSRNDSLRNKIALSWVPEQIGKGDAKKVDDFLLDWISEESNKLVIMFDLPTLLRDVMKNDKKRVLDFLARIELKDDGRLMILCKTLEMVLSEEHKRHPRDQDFVDRAFDFVCSVAKSRGINHTQIEPGLDDKLMRTLAIVDSLERPKRKADFTIVKNNLKYCPNVVSLLGQTWFDEKIAKQDSSHPLIALLSIPEPDSKKINSWIDEFKISADKNRQASIIQVIAWEIEPLAVLEHMDKAVGVFLKDKQPKLGRIKDGLVNPDEYYQTVGELLLSAHLKSAYSSTEMQYKVAPDRPVDCKVDIDGTEILVEIINPDISLELKYVRTLIGVDNRAREKIKEKLEKQIPAIAKASGLPIFLAINRTRGMDIDDIMVTDSLYGTMQLTFLVDKQKGAVVESYPTRANDAISAEASGKLISGIILFKTDLDLTDCKVKLYGDVYKNSNTDRSVGDDIIQKIKTAIFNKTLA